MRRCNKEVARGSVARRSFYATFILEAGPLTEMSITGNYGIKWDDWDTWTGFSKDLPRKHYRVDSDAASMCQCVVYKDKCLGSNSSSSPDDVRASRNS